MKDFEFRSFVLDSILTMMYALAIVESTVRTCLFIIKTSNST
jgi:hypothetical protein